MLEAAFKDSLYVIRDEMSVTLSDARAALEVAIDSGQTEHLSIVHALMHAASGAFTIIQLPAAAKLSDEVEKTLAQLMQGQARDRKESLEAITAAVVILPRFFAKTMDSDGVENPISLLPILKDLRDARNGGELSDSTLQVMALDPSMFVDGDDVDKPIEFERSNTAADLQELVAKYRPIFQASLLGWIKGVKADEHLHRLATIAEKFEQAAKEEKLFKFWWLTGGVVEALQENGLKADAELRRVLGQVDRSAKSLLDKGEEEFANELGNDLLNQLLSLVKRTRSNGDKISRIRKGFGLYNNMDDRELLSVAQDAMAAPDSSVMASLSSAIKEDLEQVKDALDIFNRTGSRENLELESRFASLKKIAETLGMLGLIELKDRLITQQENLEELIGSDEKITDDHLIPIAASLLQVETRLEAELSKLAGSSGEDEIPKYLEEALLANFREIKVNLARVKESIAEFMLNPMEVKAISRAPVFLQEAAAATRMAEKERLADIFDHLQSYITRQLIGSGRLPYPEHLELLAGAIESSDFYLETLAKGRRDPWYMLDNAETCLEKLVVSAPEPLVGTGTNTATVPVLDIDVDIDASGATVMPALSESTGVLSEAKASTVITPRLDLNPSNDSHPDAYPVMDRSLETDPELIEYFIEECKEVHELMDKEFSIWLEDPSNEPALTTVRRSFHTLKGSGRMVGALRLGEFSWQAENLINRILDNTIKVDDAGIDLLRNSVKVVPSLIEQLESGANTRVDVHALMLNVEKYTTQKLKVQEDDSLTRLPGDIDNPNARFNDTRHFDSVDELINSDNKEVIDDTTATKIITDRELTSEFVVVDATQIQQAVSLENDPVDGQDATAFSAQHTQIIDMRNIVLDDAIVAEEPPQTQIIDMRNQLSGLYDVDIDSEEDLDADTISSTRIFTLDETLNQILQEETKGHLSVIRDFAKNSIGSPVSNDLHRAAHTLHGSVHMAEIDPMVELSSVFENLVQKLYDQGLPVEQDVAALMLSTADQLEAMVVTLNTTQEMPIADQSFIDSLRSVRSSVITQIFEEEFVNEALGNNYYEIEETNYNSTLDLSGVVISDSVEIEALDTREDTTVQDEALSLTSLNLDEDILEIFLEEANDIITSTDENLTAWDDSGIPKNNLLEIQRNLHTIKGGARMAGLLEFGDFTHEMESYVLAIQTQNKLQDPDARRLLQRSVDHLHHMLDEVNAKRVPLMNASILAEMQQLPIATSFQNEAEEQAVYDNYISETVEEKIADENEILNLVEQESVDLALAELNQEIDSLVRQTPEIEQVNLTASGFERSDQNVNKPADPLFSLTEEVISATQQQSDIEKEDDVDEVLESLEMERVTDIFDYKVTEVANQQAQNRQQDAARISTGNLESLLNQAGEISIYRSRIEQEITNAGLNLNELARTVQRVREQLRSMEIETEAQILHQYKDEITNDEFDPLEMDRYSNIQQLSRALAESVNDLQSLDNLLNNQLRETESLLLQQSRIVTDLQDGLMRVRMIPFARYAPRFARIVRQVSNEVGKEVELKVEGAESEIDRQVIERMQGPLEHMIRNAIIHGIESPELRKQVGKDTEGEIKLTLNREGVNLLLSLEDDGAGLNFDSIRKKALALNLIEEGQDLSEGDLAQLILVSGFSTAGQVTKNAGRGVGMDVVANEIKQLGGSLQIHSESGVGTQFNMRLPFTRAINHALMVSAGEENYAVPLHKIDGIATITLQALQRLLESDNPTYRYGNYDYDVKTLAELVGLPRVAFDSEDNTVNLVLVTGSDHRAALAVHALHGNREMVIKPVGPQIAGIRGVSGATILGDGRIIIILDVDTLLGTQFSENVETIVESTTGTQLPLIMVVDDSITVRRVTERLLERNQMQVITARDGLDALSMLQEHVPDIILMDIEMPRMDGYELAQRVRESKDTQNIPIIMITSRTGDKHRTRAIEIGVNDYLGKPYREDQLLDAIKPFINPEEAA